MSTEHLEVVFGVKNAPLKAGIDQAMQYVSDFRREVGSKFAGALAGLGFGAAIKSLVEYAAEIADLSDKFDVSTDVLQRWGLAAETNASTAGALAGAFNKLIIAQSKAQQGEVQMIKDFESLGVSIDDIRTLDAEGLMRKMATGTLEAANITRVLGENALELVPTLRAVADGSAEMGAVIKEETIRSLAAAEDKIKEFNQMWTGVKGKAAEFAIEAAQGWKALVESAKIDRSQTERGFSIQAIYEDASTILAAQMTEEDQLREKKSRGAAAEREDIEKTGRLRERIADMRAKADELMMSKMDQLVALGEKELRLVAERDSLGRDTAAGLEKQVAIEHTKLAITQLYLEIQKEEVDLAEKMRQERQKVADQHEKELKAGQAALHKEQGKLAVLREEVAGRDDVARRLERQLDFQERMKDIEEQIVEARKDGNTALAETLTRLKAVVSQQQTLASDVAREALARNGGQAPTTTQLRRQRRADQRAERAAERFRGRLVDGVIPTARDIAGRPTRGIDPVTGEERPIAGGPPPLDVFKNPDPRKGPEQMGPPMPPGGRPGGDLQRPGDPAAQNPNSEVVAELKNVVVKLEEIRRKVEPPLDVG